MLSNNEAGAGGGVYSAANSQTTIEGSTFVYNEATFDGSGGGGGAGHFVGEAEIYNSTLSHNFSNNGMGGAIFSGLTSSGLLTITHSTIYSNTGGGVDTLSSDTIAIGNSIIVDNTDSIFNENCASAVVDLGYNLENNTACGFSATSVGSTDPILLALADNESTVTAGVSNEIIQTHALSDTSPALNQIPAGTNGCGSDYTTDQRGVARPQYGSCDLGAYEQIETDACFVQNSDSLTTYASVYADAVQDAVDEATAGDLLKIAGTCTGVQAHDTLFQTVYISKSLTLEGGYDETMGWDKGSYSGIFTTTLDADQLGAVIFIKGSGIEVELDSLTVINGSSGSEGAGIVVIESEGVTVHNSVISDNTIVYDSWEVGAGIMIQNSSWFTLTESTLTHNKADHSGGGFRLKVSVP